MASTIEGLKALIADGNFHHATYRDFGTVWEGLWIYQKDEKGYNGFIPWGCFGKDDLIAQHIAYELVRGTGISVGAYGRG